MVSPRITRGSSVLPDSVEEKVTAVASDHQSGATHLARRALRAFDLFVASGELDRTGVAELARRLEDAQPAMASVRHVARLAAKVLLENTDQWPAFRDAMQRDFDEGKRRAARNFVKLLERPATVVTLSRSTNVFECLMLARQRELLQQVLVLESRPLREGVEFAHDLHEAGVPVAVIADGAAGAYASEIALGLVGADTVFADGSVVNKAGTYALAALLRVADRPFYVACESFKIDTTRGPADWRPPPEQGPAEISSEVPARNPYFDLTPAKLVTAIATDRGVLKPDMIAKVLR